MKAIGFNQSVLFLAGLIVAQDSVSLNALAAQRSFPTDLPERPQWSYEDGRKVIGGDILHLGVGSGSSIEAARFRAEALAVRSLIHECGVAHREIKIWDRYGALGADGVYYSFVRAGLSFFACEQAQRARGEALEAMASPTLLRDQRRLEELERKELEQGPEPEKHEQEDEGEREGRFLAAIRGTEKRLGDAIEDLARESRRPAGPMVLRQTMVQLPNRAPLSAESYRICMEESRLMLEDAQTAALSVHPAGNLVDPTVMPLYNRAMKKQDSCNRLATGF